MGPFCPSPGVSDPVPSPPGPLFPPVPLPSPPLPGPVGVMFVAGSIVGRDVGCIVGCVVGRGIDVGLVVGLGKIDGSINCPPSAYTVKAFVICCVIPSESGELIVIVWLPALRGVEGRNDQFPYVSDWTVVLISVPELIIITSTSASGIVLPLKRGCWSVNVCKFLGVIICGAVTIVVSFISGSPGLSASEAAPDAVAESDAEKAENLSSREKS